MRSLRPCSDTVVVCWPFGRPRVRNPTAQKPVPVEAVSQSRTCDISGSFQGVCPAPDGSTRLPAFDSQPRSPELKGLLLPPHSRLRLDITFHEWNTVGLLVNGLVRIMPTGDLSAAAPSLGMPKLSVPFLWTSYARCKLDRPSHNHGCCFDRRPLCALAVTESRSADPAWVCVGCPAARFAGSRARGMNISIHTGVWADRFLIARHIAVRQRLVLGSRSCKAPPNPA